MSENIQGTVYLICNGAKIDMRRFFKLEARKRITKEFNIRIAESQSRKTGNSYEISYLIDI